MSRKNPLVLCPCIQYFQNFKMLMKVIDQCRCFHNYNHDLGRLEFSPKNPKKLNIRLYISRSNNYWEKL